LVFVIVCPWEGDARVKVAGAKISKNKAVLPSREGYGEDESAELFECMVINHLVRPDDRDT
jgi:hypothetical protein